VPAYFAFLIVLVLAWGAFAFGAVYDWAYVPLLWACTGVGVLGCLAPGASGKAKISRAIVAGVLALAAAVVVQSIPLSPGAIASISPATDRLLADYDVTYMAGRATAAASYRHPLSIDPQGTRLGLASLAAFAVLLTGVARGLGRRSLRALAVGLVITGAALALAGIVQSGLGVRDPERTGLVYGFWKPLFGTDPFGPFINRNHFAGWMLLALPVAIGYFSALVARGMRGVKPTFRDRVLWFSSPDASRVILVGLAIAVMGVSLVLTLSRSGISGFLLAVAISAWFVLRRQGRGSKRAVTMGYLGLLLALSLGWAGIDAVVQRFAEAKGTGLNGRLPIWTDTWNVVRDFPLTGTGLNTFGTSMLFYQEHDLETRAEEAHNDYLQLAAEGGVLVGVPAIVLAVILGRTIRRRFREGADDAMAYWLRVGATTGLVAIGLQETVEFSLQIPGIVALFAVVAAIAIHGARS
jgi:hypothetical protein